MATKLIRGLYNFKPNNQGVVATIGNFDGVHLGHQALITEIKQKAKNLGLKSLVITFEPQPLEFFLGNKSVPRLTRFREKFLFLADSGVDHVLVLSFNQALAGISANDFIEDLLVNKLKVKHLVVGEDFHFGKSREGDINFLHNAAAKLPDFSVKTKDNVIIGGERVSSTRIRQELVAGKHALAETLLGKPYSMMGRIVHGNKLGRTLGIPTANIHLHRKNSAVSGIYTVITHGISKEPLNGVANVGIRPTIGGTRSLLEVHLLDFNDDIYGKYVTVEFCEKLRDEEKYPTLDALKTQMLKDVDSAREYFEKIKI